MTFVTYKSCTNMVHNEHCRSVIKNYSSPHLPNEETDSETLTCPWSPSLERRIPGMGALVFWCQCPGRPPSSVEYGQDDQRMSPWGAWEPRQDCVLGTCERRFREVCQHYSGKDESREGALWPYTTQTRPGNVRSCPCAAGAGAAAETLELVAALGQWFSACPRPAAAASPGVC